MNGQHKKDIKIGSSVMIVEKQNQRNGNLTKSTVSRILTNSATHPQGIKVMLEDGTVGRVKEIL